MGVLALHGQNYKAAQLSALHRHNMRLNERYSNTNIDRNRTAGNVVLIAPHGGLYQAARNRINKEVQQYQKKSIRKDANWATEFIVTVPEGIRDNRERTIGYCNAVVNYFAKRIGRDNIISAVIHMDETTPHMHLDFTPIVNHKLSAKQIMTRSFLRSLHDELPVYLQQLGYDVERGQAEPQIDHRKGQNIHEYKRQAEVARKELAGQLRALQSARDDLMKGNYMLAKQIIDRHRDRSR